MHRETTGLVWQGCFKDRVGTSVPKKNMERMPVSITEMAVAYPLRT